MASLKEGQKVEDVFFKEERQGWSGYIEWERYPEKKKEAERILAKYHFPDVCSSNEALDQGNHVLIDNYSHQSFNYNHYRRLTPFWRENDSRSAHSMRTLLISLSTGIPRSPRPHFGLHPRAKLGHRQEGEISRYASRPSVPIQRRTTARKTRSERNDQERGPFRPQSRRHPRNRS